jgi:hypothetical protein
MAVAAMALITSAFPASATAQTAAQAFEQARQAYFRGEFQEVVGLLEPLVGGVVPSVRDRILVRESRKYLGAAYVLTDQIDRARAQFEALLRSEGEHMEGYTLDPAAFPAEVLRVFGAVRARLIEELRTDEAERARLAAERERRRRQALMALVHLAEIDEDIIPHEPGLAWIPFGVGQFQNGDETLGGFFLGAETATMLSGLIALTIWAPLLDAHDEMGRTSTIDVGVLRGLQIANIVSFSAFGVLAIAGIIEAHVRFVPSHTVRREREIPADILESLELTVGPASVGLRLRF